MEKSKGFDIVIGTRPDVIKFAPLILEMDKRNIPFHIYHELQHEDFNMFGLFLNEFNLNNFSRSTKHKHSTVLIYGDTDGALKQAHWCKRNKLKVIHVEAGLRCGDKSMWEEQNRKMIDAISDYWFAPTLNTANNLLSEKIALVDKQNIFHTGNLIVDALDTMLGSPSSSISSLSSIEHILITIHRRENIYHPDFKKLLFIIRNLQKKYSVVWPIHPHTKSQWNGYLDHIEHSPPIGYLDFLKAILKADLIITDSGGVLEETCILNRRCIVLREYTERQETLTRNARMCFKYGGLETMVGQMLATPLPNYDNPYTGKKGITVAETMCDILEGL